VLVPRATVVIPILANSTIAGRGVGEHEWMSEVGEREMTAEGRVVGLLVGGKPHMIVRLGARYWEKLPSPRCTSHSLRSRLFNLVQIGLRHDAGCHHLSHQFVDQRSQEVNFGTLRTGVLTISIYVHPLRSPSSKQERQGICYIRSRPCLGDCDEYRLNAFLAIGHSRRERGSAKQPR